MPNLLITIGVRENLQEDVESSLCHRPGVELIVDATLAIVSQTTAFGTVVDQPA